MKPRRQTKPGCKWRADRNCRVLPTVATIALVIGRTPGAEASRWLVSELLCQATICASVPSIRPGRRIDMFEDFSDRATRLIR
jgi:hypothetical protein